MTSLDLPTPLDPATDSTWGPKVNTAFGQLVTVADAAYTLASGAVLATGDSTISGVKTFSSPVGVPDAATDDDATNKGQVADMITTAVGTGTVAGFYLSSGDDSDLAAALAPFAGLGRPVLVPVAGS